MTAGDTMRRLFKAIADLEREQASKPPIVDGPIGPPPHKGSAAQTPIARAVFRQHPDGIGFTIDGSLRPGQPTRPGDMNSGEFIGLTSGHAVARLKAWANNAGMPWRDELGFEGNLTTWFLADREGC